MLTKKIIKTGENVIKKLADFAVAVVITAAMMGNTGRLNHWVQLATTKVLWESRSSNWGSPRFFPEKKNSR